MKRLWIAVLIIMFAFCGFVYAEPEIDVVVEDKVEISTLKEIAELVGKCPTKGLIEDCLKCHEVPNFEVDYDYPNSHIRIHEGVKGKKFGYYMLKGITDDTLKEAFEFLDELDIKSIVIEVHSPGGSMMSVLRIIGVMDYYRNKNFTIETRCYGFAASAGFMILVAGDKGRRFVSPTSLLMWHEVQTFKQYDLSSPSKKADEAEILRFFQNNANLWLSDRCNLTKEEIDEHVYKSEWWMSGKEAVEFSIADSFI